MVTSNRFPEVCGYSTAEGCGNTPPDINRPLIPQQAALSSVSRNLGDRETL